jgi:hypothetical protein
MTNIQKWILTKPLIKNFLFCASLIAFAIILLHIFPIRIVIDARNMWGADSRPLLDFRTDGTMPPLRVFSE